MFDFIELEENVALGSGAVKVVRCGTGNNVRGT